VTIHTYTNASLHTCICTYCMHMLYIRTYINTHIHTHTRIIGKWNMGNGPRKLQHRTHGVQVQYAYTRYRTTQQFRLVFNSKFRRELNQNMNSFTLTMLTVYKQHWAILFNNERRNVQFKLQIFRKEESFYREKKKRDKTVQQTVLIIQMV
jgi:hypothetical protein